MPTKTQATNARALKNCTYCHEDYPPRKYEKPARNCCYKPSCERQRDVARYTPAPEPKQAA